MKFIVPSQDPLGAEKLGLVTTEQKPLFVLLSNSSGAYSLPRIPTASTAWRDFHLTLEILCDWQA